MKPDISFVLKSGHFHLLTTLTVGRSLARNEGIVHSAARRRVKLMSVFSFANAG